MQTVDNNRLFNQLTFVYIIDFVNKYSNFVQILKQTVNRIRGQDKDNKP